jgi:hypothetical protein
MLIQILGVDINSKINRIDCLHSSFPPSGGAGILTFFRKVRMNKKYPIDPVNPV